MTKADLHIHTTESDGKMKPKQVVKEAANLNLSVISITDHDTIAGIPVARQEAEKHDIEVLGGVEITTSFGARECHLLAYDFNLNDDSFNNLLSDHQHARFKRAEWILDQLRKKGFELDINEVLAEAGSKNIGRPHIATILRKKGYIHSVKEGFIRYLNDDTLGPIQNNYYSCPEVIDKVKQAGGVTILAHPGRMYDEDEFLQFVEAGIDGIEVIHPGHNGEIQKKMEEFADTHNLLASGGSDFHGKMKDYYRHFGSLTIALSRVEKIKALAQQRKEITV